MITSRLTCRPDGSVAAVEYAKNGVELGPAWQWQMGGGWAEIVPYVTVLVVLIWRPHGLMGQKEVERI